MENGKGSLLEIFNDAKEVESNKKLGLIIWLIYLVKIS
jgi:hypothetical protein